MSGNARLEH